MYQNTSEYPVLYPGWTTVRKLGNGSFGSVYEIERRLFETTERAALKIINVPKDPAEIDELYSSGYDEAGVRRHCETLLQNIVREYEIMVGMKGNSNVVSCEDIQCWPKEDGVGWTICIKMELLTPLMKVLDRVETEDQVCKFGEDLCKALVLCHGLNVIHRDIKPQNIFLARDGSFKLGDFGIAKVADQVNRGTRIGTVSYMAPEVYTDLPYGHGADIYSLGVVLYWLLNEKRLPLVALPPASPTALDVQDACLARLHGHALPPPVNASPEMSSIILKACAYNPAERYASAREMLEQLQALRIARSSAGAAPVCVKPERSWSAGETTVLSQQDSIPPAAAPQQTWQNPAPYRQPAQPEAPAAAPQQTWQRPAFDQQPARPQTSADGGGRKRKLGLIAVIAAGLVILGVGLALLLGGRSGSSRETEAPTAPPPARTTEEPAPQTSEQPAVTTEAPDTEPTQTAEPTEPATTEAPAVLTWEPGIHTYEFVQGTCDWDEAWATAREMGGHLVCFETEEELQYVLEQRAELAPRLCYLRIGAKRDDDKEEYYWRDGNCEAYGVRLDSEEAWCFGLWRPGEPTFVWKGNAETVCTLQYDWDNLVWEFNDAGNAVSDSLNPDTVGFIVEYE